MARRMPSSLQHLELVNCGFGLQGAMAIAQLLSQLRILIVIGNDLSGKGIDAFERALPNSPIEKLYCNSTNLNYEETKRFRGVWAAAQKREDQLLMDVLSE